jgi:heparan-alpha-glucosaminide N-acetyltransferase
MQRLASLDAFRGFVILAMIWVNCIAGMPGIPYWLEHSGPRADGVTLPDLVFPGFLFIVGVAIPLALRRAAADGMSARLFGKLLWRSASLMLAGVMLLNADRYDASAAALPRAWYYLLFYIAMILLWRQDDARRWPKWLGGALMLALVLAFRPVLETGWWGILGMIGWGYLACSVAFVLAGGGSAPLAGVFAAMLALYLGGMAGALDWLPPSLRSFVNIPQVLGSTAANVMAGVLVGNLFRADMPHRLRMRQMAWMALAFLAAGLLLRPYHGINKIHATAAYTLVCAAIALALFLFFYWLVDVRQQHGTVAWLLPAGGNALLAYILPDLFEQAAAVLHLRRMWWPFLESGRVPGLLNAAAMTALMLMLVASANRAGLRLKF